MKPSDPPALPVDADHPKHQPDAVSSRWILITAAIVALCVLLSFVAAGIMTSWMAHMPPQRVGGRQVEAHKPARVSSWITPGQELVHEKQTWHDHLETYSWIDRNKGIVRIPIERAMQLLVAQQPPQAHPEAHAQEAQP
jgi:hypothetical protein